MKISVNVDDNYYRISDAELIRVVAGLSDCPENRPLFDVLAQHPEADVRIAIASKQHLSPEVAANLRAAEQMRTVGDLLIDNYRLLEHLFEHFQASPPP